ncbi:MAG: acylphosphatase [Bacteroidota bacterium]
MKHYNISVFGKVQGVFYRASTKTKALELGIKGFVKNQSDGSVYIEAEGNEERLKQLVEWCNRGPSNAVVTQVKVAEAEAVGFDKFETQYF